MRKLFLISTLLSLLTIAACGGGGGGGAPVDPAPVLPTVAALRLSVSGPLPVDTLIGGLDVTVVLPPGVTVRSTAAPMIDGDAVTATGLAGAGASVMGTYNAASGAAPGTVRVLLADPDGMAAGEFATVTCDIATGTTVAATDFTTSALYAADLNGAALAGLTAGLDAAFR